MNQRVNSSPVLLAESCAPRWISTGWSNRFAYMLIQINSIELCGSRFIVRHRLLDMVCEVPNVRHNLLAHLPFSWTLLNAFSWAECLWMFVNNHSRSAWLTDFKRALGPSDSKLGLDSAIQIGAIDCPSALSNGAVWKDYRMPRFRLSFMI